ncbi:MAG: SusC/RagA family TonB-linked outer membrane protein [Bacteroidales bacterium]|uniref:SusC/RagA family TonB-linked outer membrane protein n=1 Tax=Sodaliphilus sp. TaxID=2815818 RepID=UPI001B64A2D0|nr:SusC/RagA family TonB-linked outer membrane protein [Candidatus Sodaliphilus limicaballi]
MRKQLMLLLFSVLAVMGYARTVTGVVTQASDGDVVIGATVQVHGTTRGTATDFDGKYSIDVNDGETLDISFVGMVPVSIKVTAGKSVINVEMKEDAQVLDAVVVTAMGQTQEKKKLNFAVQQLNSDQVTAGGSANFANSLQGKVAGLQVGTGGGSPNSSTQVIIRAISSVNNSQSNEPLIIVDGVAMKSSSATSLGDINPNDIESMSVLKGAAASALYGQEAANGVIMITTKSGAKDGTLNVTASASVEISNAMRVPKLQSLFAPGSKGMYKENSSTGGWGPYIQPGEQTYNNLGNFLGTGIQQKYDASISGGTEKFNSYASVSYLDSEGIVPKDYKKQFIAFLKSSFNPSKQVNFQLSMNFTDTQSRGFGNSMSSIYAWGINKNMADYQTLEGHVNWRARYDHWDELTDLERINCGASPYYGRYNDKSVTKSNHFVLNGQASYTPIEDLVITGRVGYDKSFSSYDSYSIPRLYDGDLRDPNDEKVIQALSGSQSIYGSYSFQPSQSQMINLQGLVTYKKTFAEDFTFNALFGAEYKRGSSWEASIYGEHFQLGGDYYSFMNTNFNDGDLLKDNHPTLYHRQYDKYGYFGELRFDYKGMAQLSATYRHDGSSRFKQAPETSYNYPSITAGVIFSELFHLQNKWFSYGKIRGNWAKVGKDGPAYLFTDTYKQWVTFPDGGYGVDPTIGRAYDLHPEMTSTWEIGADLRFFNSRTRLDIAYYSTTVDNQIVTVRVSPASGMILQTRNEGAIENRGLELTLNQDIIKTNDFEWTALLNYSFNRGKVLSLPDDVIEIQGTQYGDIFPVARLGGSTTGISGKDYSRDPQGNVICDANGYPIIDSAKGIYIGNREPKFLLGLGSTFRYKNATLSFLFDGRCGGDVVNVTGRGLIGNGMDHHFDKYRNREIIFNGVQAVTGEDGTTTYVKNTTPVILDYNFITKYFNTVSSNFIEDGSYIRLSYVTLNYDFTPFFKKTWPVKGLGLTVTGRNLLLLTKYTGNDPSILASTAGGTGGMGIDNYNVPSTRSFNVTLKATF